VLRFFRLAPNRTVIVAGSTMPGEDAAVLGAFAKIKSAMPGSLLVLAPRHPERFMEVERLARSAGFVTAKRSDLPIDAEPRADVVILDTLGELAQLYQVSTAVFVGGSLVDYGGHNILEPAIFGRPIVLCIYAELQNRGRVHRQRAAIQVQTERRLNTTLSRAGHRPVRRAASGTAARAGRAAAPRQTLG
jgi:3-deoxy-D-manno-octulosonic-acid transferase